MVDEIIKRDEIDILNDICFKSLFRSVEARGMVSRFLSALTGISKERFLNAEYVGGELTKKKLTERGKIADIIIKLDEEDETCIVEMNKYDTGDIIEKNLSYAFSVFNESTKKGIRKWPKVILINIDNFNRFNADEPIIELEMRDTKNKYIEKINGKTSEDLIKGLEKIKKRLKIEVKSITADNGSENMDYKGIKKVFKYEIEVYYAHPYCSWARGLNENTNRMIRRFYHFNIYAVNDKRASSF